MDYDLIIIGSGPAGYVAAIRAGQLGLKTAIVEKEKIGGMCLNLGCIPTKALLESAKKFNDLKSAKDFGIDGLDIEKLSFNWKKAVKRSNKIVARLTKGVQFLIKKNAVEIITGEAEIVSGHSIRVNNRILETKNIILATGSKSKKIEFDIPDDIAYDVGEMLKSDIQAENIIVYGQGPHALELTQFFGLSGKKVTQLVPNNELLPEIDSYLVDYFKKSFKKAKIDIIYDADNIEYQNGSIIVNDKQVDCDMFINASLRKAVIPKSEKRIETEDEFVKCDNDLRTNIPSIFAIGDINGKLMLAHSASIQALKAVNSISGINDIIDYKKIPMNMYTYPEMAQIGMTESELKSGDIDYKISEFPLSANGKAMTEGFTDGFVRILSEKKYGEVLGTQIIALHATDMIAEAAAIMGLEGTIYDVAKIAHAHPTTSEIFMEAGYAAFDQPIHK